MSPPDPGRRAAGWLVGALSAALAGVVGLLVRRRWRASRGVPSAESSGRSPEGSGPRVEAGEGHREETVLVPPGWSVVITATPADQVGAEPTVAAVIQVREERANDTGRRSATRTEPIRGARSLPISTLMAARDEALSPLSWQGSLISAGCLAVGFVVMLLGMLLLFSTPHQTINALVTGVGLAGFVLGLVAGENPGVAGRLQDVIGRMSRFLGVEGYQLAPLAVGLFLSLGSRSAAGDGALSHSVWHGPMWVLGMALVVGGLWRKASWTARRWPSWREAGLAIGILAFALGTRLWALGDVPYGVNGDEGSAGLVGIEYLAGARNNLLDVAWHSFPSFYFWLVALSQRLLGTTIAAVRLPSALAGSLAVLAVYWAAKRLFGQPHALFSGLLVSALHLHVMFSRIAVSNVFDTLFLAIALGSLWVGWMENQRWAFLAAGLAIGLGQYFYPTARLLVFLGVVWVGLLHFLRPATGRRDGLVAMVLVAVAAGLPLGLYFLDNWNKFVAPLKAVSIFHTGWLEGTMAATGQTAAWLVARQFVTAAGGLVVEPLHGIYTPGVPMLRPLPAALFAAGFASALVRLKDVRGLLLLAALPATIVASALSIEAPSAQRLLFAVPLIALIIPLPITQILERLGRHPMRWRAAVCLAALVLALGMAVDELRFSFARSIPLEGYGDRASDAARAIGDYLRGLPEDTPVYLCAKPLLSFGAFPSLLYLARNVEPHDMPCPPGPENPLPIVAERSVFVFLPEYTEALSFTATTYPGQTIAHRDGTGSVVLYAHFVTPSPPP